MKTAPLLALGLSLSLSSIASADITLEQGYFRASPPGVSTGAAFLTLHNTDQAPVALLHAQTPAATSAELHNHIKQEGVMQMRQVDAIEIPTHGSLNLRPGGYHIMLMGLKAPLTEGHKMPLLLEFSNGQRLELQLPVKRVHGSSMPHKMQPHQPMQTQ